MVRPATSQKNYKSAPSPGIEVDIKNARLPKVKYVIAQIRIDVTGPALLLLCAVVIGAILIVIGAAFVDCRYADSQPVPRIKGIAISNNTVNGNPCVADVERQQLSLSQWLIVFG